MEQQAHDGTDRVLRIEYCTGWGYVKRAAGLAEQVLHDYHKNLPGGVSLVPGSGGVFEITLGERPIFSKKEAGRFPEAGEVLGRLEEMLGPHA